MWVILFLLIRAQAGPELDFQFFKAKVEPIFLEKRPGHARCVSCHARSTAFRLAPLARGQTAWTDEQSRANFEMARKFVRPDHPRESRLLVMPLSHEAGGTEFHPGGKHWESTSDPEWKALGDWVNGAK